MSDKDFQLRLNELVVEIGTLPPLERRVKRKAPTVLTEQTHQQEGTDASNLQKSIDFLRLSIKYILFDLEATRRENQYLRKMLETDAG